MNSIIDPIPKASIKEELEQAYFLRQTVKAGNKLYVTDAQNNPLIMKEIGRLRELSFRAGGGGSGEPLDIDPFDLRPNSYKQLIVWNPDEEEIIGGYRFFFGKDMTLTKEGQPDIAMSHIMQFSPKFMRDYMPSTIEMGRAFIQPKYQMKSGGLKSLYALDNLWDGIGSLMVLCPNIEYLIGKVTIYSTMGFLARKAIEFYFHYYLEDTTLIQGVRPETFPDSVVEYWTKAYQGLSFKEGFKLMQNYVKEHHETVPALIRAYVELSDTMQTFNTVFDPDFGAIYDTGMMITLSDVYASKRKRYIGSFQEECQLKSKEFNLKNIS